MSNDKNDKKDLFGRLLDKFVKKLESGIVHAIENAELTQNSSEDGNQHFSFSIQFGNKKHEIGSIEISSKSGESQHPEPDDHDSVQNSPQFTLIPAEKSLSKFPDSLEIDDKRPVVQMSLSEAVKANSHKKDHDIENECSKNEDLKASSEKTAETTDLEPPLGLLVCDGILAKYTGSEITIELPENIRQIGPYAFENARIESITLPKSLEIISRGAFRANHALKNISFQHGLKEIGDSAFEDCDELERIDLPDSVQTIGKYTFRGCSELREIRLPKDLREIPDGLFEDCIQLETVIWPEHVEKCGNELWKGCFDDDAWEIFELKNGEYRRRPAPAAILDPDGRCDLNCSAYARQILNRLLNEISADIEPERVREQMSQLLASIGIADILSGGMPYARLQAVWRFADILQQNKQNLRIPENTSFDYITGTFEAISGSGNAVKQFDNRIYRDIFGAESDKPEDRASELICGIMNRLYVTVMSDLGEIMSPDRYHPGIFRHAAWIRNDENYWNFAFSLEGLLRSHEIALPHNVPCDHADSVDVWIRKWSESIAGSGFGILRFGSPTQDRFGGFYIALASRTQAEKIYAECRKLQLENHLSGWFSGENIFGLMLI